MYVTPTGFTGGMNANVLAMTADIKHLGIISENLSKLGMPGYQGKQVVRRPFIEHLGAETIESVADTRLGRLRQTGSGEDFALGSEGYFQTFNPNTGQVSLTRSGQSSIDQDGYMRTITGQHYLDAHGDPIKFPNRPVDPAKQVKIDEDGTITYLDQQGRKYDAIGKLGIVNEAGNRPEHPMVYHLHLEEGNITLQEQFLQIVPTKRYFEANSQVFKLQGEALQRMLQELGRPQ
jgi:flagellar basal-body rod protein FlgF